MSSKASKLLSAMGDMPNKQEILSKTSMVLQNIVDGGKPEYRYVNIDNIQYNQLNDYAVDDSQQGIVDLASDIQMNGLLHNIVVFYTDQGEYKLLSGERRLRAYHYLHDTTHDAKYSEIYALIRTGLSETEEMLILDAANLQTRGGFGNEKRFRKATVRFIDNLKKQFGVDYDLAVSLTKQYVDVSESVINKNIAIETNLHDGLVDMLDEGTIAKNQAYEYSKLPQGLQNSIADNLESAKSSGDSTVKRLNDDIFDQTRERKKKLEVVKTAETGLEQTQEEIQAVDARIQEFSTGDDDYSTARVDELTAVKEQLQEQADAYKDAAENAKRAVKNTERKMARTQTADAQTAQDDISADIDKKIKKLEAAIHALGGAAFIEKLDKLGKRERDGYSQRLRECARLIPGGDR